MSKAKRILELKGPDNMAGAEKMVLEIEKKVGKKYPPEERAELLKKFADNIIRKEELNGPDDMAGAEKMVLEIEKKIGKKYPPEERAELLKKFADHIIKKED